MTKTSMRAENIDVYGFFEPQSIQRSGQSQFESESYIKNWMQNSKRDVYLGAYLNGALKGLEILNKVNPSLLLGGLLLKQKGNTECGYYNNWEMYFTDSRPLEPERLKALRNQWAKYYLKVKNETYDV
ncbi:hypothetical protein GmHk_08G022992 [Glycine max]|nr:hypothetical protein GmHk_08G022992 [Glycine max]